MGFIRTRGLLPALAVPLLLMTNVDALACGLAGSEWRPTQIDEQALPDSSGIFVRFEAEGRLTGHAGCNRFFGSYEMTDDGIAIGPLGATRMACPGPIMELETAFLQVLEQVSSFVRDGPRLELGDAQGNIRAIFIQTDWD